MLSKNKLKYINSLSLKKIRDVENVFVAEGVKLVSDLIPSFECKYLFYTDEYADVFLHCSADEKNILTVAEMEKISFQRSPQGVMAVFYKKELAYNLLSVKNQLSLALDGIQDPGNLGTIIRIADWFGIRHVYCSKNCADVYGNKTIQATMGAISRVNVYYVDLCEFLNDAKTVVPIYGTFMDGKNIYDAKLTENGVIVLGNEGNGISSEVEGIVDSKLLIPSFPVGVPTSESLNVGVAAAIVCAEFRRRIG